MDFSSDTSAPAHPRVIEAMTAANVGAESSYGDDGYMARLRESLTGIFETEDFDFWACASGTASNALALSCFCPPTGAVLCHANAHVSVDERGAPEFFSGGGKLQLLGGEGGKIDETELNDALARINHDFVHETPAHVLSLTNLTESGTAYRAAKIVRFAASAHEAGLIVHMDGARLANALAFTSQSPADMTWRAGVDVLTFGLTKTGAIGCELILLFGRARKKSAELRARAKRSGHMPPKMRYIAAQGLALLEDDLWLELAKTANARALQLSDALVSSAGARLSQSVEGNEVFAELSTEVAAQLQSAGAKFYPWPDGSHRFVCSWTTTEADIDVLVNAL